MIDLFRNDAQQTFALPQLRQIKEVRHPRGESAPSDLTLPIFYGPLKNSES